MTIRHCALALVIALGVACNDAQPTTTRATPVVLRIGLGVGNSIAATAGVQQAVSGQVLEGLLRFPGNGRLAPWLAAGLDGSPDRLTWRIHLRPNARFHDGRVVDGEVARQSLLASLPRSLGPVYDDILEIRVAEQYKLEIVLRRRSNFVIEGLDTPISPADDPTVGTAAFKRAKTSEGRFEMVANENYYQGRPAIDRIVFQQYPSTRAAWADLLRGNVDALYDVDPEAIASMEGASGTEIHRFTRSYTSLVVLNNRRAPFSRKEFRQAISAAIDRERFVKDGLQGLGLVVSNPVWPEHWASDPNAPSYRYDPHPLPGTPQRFTCMYSETAMERQAILLQRMLQAINVDITLEFVPVDEALRRVQSDQFDAWLADANQGPSLLRAYLMWHSKGVNNVGHYSSPAVDRALDQIRDAPDDAAYRAGVSAYQRAIVEDPPAIFLAWSQRARAVNRRFDVPNEPGRDILSSLRLWKPAAALPNATYP